MLRFCINYIKTIFKRCMIAELKRKTKIFRYQEWRKRRNECESHRGKLIPQQPGRVSDYTWILGTGGWVSKALLDLVTRAPSTWVVEQAGLHKAKSWNKLNQAPCNKLALSWLLWLHGWNKLYRSMMGLKKLSLYKILGKRGKKLPFRNWKASWTINRRN